jgi:signal transduction histidine kinase
MMIPYQKYYTIDIDPTKAAFVLEESDHHFVVEVENAGQDFEPFSLDASLIDGVSGFGLDDMRCAEKVV